MSEVEQMQPEPRNKWAAWVGFILHLAVLVFPYSAAGLVTPGYGLAILYAGWLGLLLVALRQWRRRPLLLLLLPVVDIAWMFGLLAFGGTVLGWTA